MITVNKVGKLALDNIHWLALFGIIVLAVWIRALNWVPGEILDFDPWWFFRHAVDILNNGFVAPEWDTQSFYPPGRPVDFYLGWSYTIAIFYAMFGSLLDMTIAEFSSIFVSIFAALSAIPAYFVGKHVTNRWGGIATAFFATVSVTFISVSIAGYTDSDGVDVFYTFLAIIGTLYAMQKAKIMKYDSQHNFIRSFIRYLPYTIPAHIAYFLFALNWSSSWYIYYMFVIFIPILIGFRVLEAFIKKPKIELPLIVDTIRDNKNIIFAILVIGFIGEAITIATATHPFNTIPPHIQLIDGLNTIGTQGSAVAMFVAGFGIIGAIVGVAFGRLTATVVGGILGIAFAVVLTLSGVTGVSLVVNQSVAELQPIGDIFADFGRILGRIGAVPMFFAFSAFFITFLKLIFKKEIHTAEYFAIIWFIISLFLITKGIRFSLLLSMAVATAAGFTIGNLIMFAKRRGSAVMLGSFVAVALIAGVLHFNDNYGFAQGVGPGVQVSDNFKAGFDWLIENADEDSLISTWWDPGHIIAGYTGLKVMADGAHCHSNSCIFFDHNTRIQEMGRAFAISDEDESAKILRRYTEFTDEQCQEVKARFGDAFDVETCKPVTELYVLATSDLIGKYFWLSFFGTTQGASYTQCFSNQAETQRLGAPTYVCQAGTPLEISLVTNPDTQEPVAVMNAPNGGIRNAFVRDLVLFQNGQQFGFRAESETAAIVDGMVWVEPSFGSIVYMQPNVRDSVFTNMFFFDGRGNEAIEMPALRNFEMVYANPEMKIFRLNLDVQPETTLAEVEEVVEQLEEDLETETKSIGIGQPIAG